jgi:hypothetical protein
MVAGRSIQDRHPSFLYSFLILPTLYIVGRSICGFIFFVDGMIKSVKKEAFRLPQFNVLVSQLLKDGDGPLAGLVCRDSLPGAISRGAFQLDVGCVAHHAFAADNVKLPSLHTGYQIFPTIDYGWNVTYKIRLGQAVNNPISN